MAGIYSSGLETLGPDFGRVPISGPPLGGPSPTGGLPSFATATPSPEFFRVPQFTAFGPGPNPPPPVGLGLGLPQAPPTPSIPAIQAPRSQIPTFEIPAERGGGGPGRGGVSRAQEALLKSYEPLAAATKKASEGEVAELEAKAEGEQRAAQEATGTALELERIQAKKTAYNDAMQAELTRDTEEIKNAQEDPNHYYNTLTSKEKFQTNAAMVLGAISGAMRGGPNVAMEDYNRRVDRDIEAQRAAIQNKRGALSAKQGLYAANLAKYGDDERATLATRAQYAAATQAQMARLATLSGTKSVQAKADMAIGLMNQEQDKLRLGFEKENLAAASAQANAMPKMIEKLRVDPDRYVETTDSTGQTVTGYAPDKETAREVRKGSLAVKDVLAGLDQIDALVERNQNAKVPWSTTSQQIESIKKELMPRFNVMFGQGAMAEGERTAMSEMIGDPTTWDPRKGGMPVLRQLRARTAQAGDRILQANNISLVERQNIKQGGITTPVALERGQMYEPTARPTASIEELGGKKVTPK